MFESIINEAKGKFDLGDKAGDLIAALLALIASPAGGGFNGFIRRFTDAGLGDLANSWITNGRSEPISGEQLETALGADTINSMADQSGVDRATATMALASITPQIVDKLTPDGEIPDEKSLLAKISGFLSDYGGAAILGGLGAGKTAAGSAANAVSDRFSSAMNSGGAVEGGDGDGGILKWLLLLILLGLIIALGFWFCGKSVPVTITNSNGANTANINANRNATATAKKIDSSFTLTARDGKYAVSGVVPDQKTLDEIKAKLTAEFGAGNVDFSGLRVDANAAPFAAGWWDNFGKLLPNLKDWKNGTLSFAGNAITEASSLPAVALEQIRALFLGWTLPASMSATATAETDRKLTEVSLPNGVKLQAYPGGIEDQLVKFIQSDEYKNGTNDTLKDKWFNFDDLNFKFGTTELVAESKRQLDNIVAILKAFPDVKIKIGGYTDKKGDDAGNKKLSADRAKAVKSSLDEAGVAAQVPEAEGYGEEFAKIPETASDEERKADRKTSVRLLK